MQQKTDQQKMAILMNAVGRLITGAADPHAALDHRVFLMAGPELDVANLLHLSKWVREKEMPLLSLYRVEDADNVPLFSMIDIRNGQTPIYMQCFVWMSESGTVHIVPDGFEHGSYVFREAEGLTHLKRSPMKDFDDGIEGMKRASEAFMTILAEHAGADGELPLPTKMERHAA